MNGLRISLARKLTAGFVGGALMTLLGCSTDDSSKVVNNSQTHWLSICTENSDCGDLSCLCGICTTECSASSACSGFSEEATCASADENGACEKDAPAKVCLAECEKDSECSNGATCESGVCSPGGSSGGDPTGPGGSDAAGGDPGTIPGDGGSSSMGLVCSEYDRCGGDEAPCGDNVECIGFSECGGGICVPFQEACDLSCASGECDLAEGYPAQLSCDQGDVIPPKPGSTDAGVADAGSSKPPGVDCDAHAACGPEDGQCDEGVNCIAIVGCANAVCIPAEEACEQSCPNPDECAIAESYPEQLSCDGRVPGFSSGTDGGMCAAEGVTGCITDFFACCPGLECCQGNPYPADGECSESCMMKSDRSVKHNVQPIDPETVLDKVSKLSISTWSYDAQPGVRHLGPMAQDFKAAFELGSSDRSIATVDAVGVALTAIQALTERVEALERENAALREATLRVTPQRVPARGVE